ncbi:MAG: carboxymuconolactone decarboxylase family protein [Shimia sp.]
MTDTLWSAMQKTAEGWQKAAKPMMDAMAGAEAMMPTMPRDMLEAFFGKGVSPEGLDAKTRLLLTLGALTAMGATAEPQLRLTVKHALEAGARPQEIIETIAQMSIFGGVPAMTKAMEIAKPILDDHDDPSRA